MANLITNPTDVNRRSHEAEIVRFPDPWATTPFFQSRPAEPGRTLVLQSGTWTFDRESPGGTPCPPFDTRHADVILALFSMGPGADGNVKCSMNELCARVAGCRNGRYIQNIYGVLDDCRSTWITWSLPDSRKAQFVIIAEYTKLTRAPRRKDARCIDQQEFWLDEVQFSKYFTAAMRELMTEVPINLAAYSTLSSRLAKAIYLYIPSRAVFHKGRENAWEIGAGKLLEQIGARVPVHAWRCRQVFTQHKRSIIKQLDGQAVASGEILRTEMRKSRKGDDILAFWVDPPVRAIAIGAEVKGVKAKNSAKPSPVAPPAPIAAAAKPPATEVPRKEVPAAKAGSAAVKGLVEAGVMDRMAKQLVEKHGEEFVLEKLHEWPFRLQMKASKWTNPAGALIRSIQEKWERPKGCRSLAQKKAEKRREAALARKQRKLDELKEEDVGIREKCEQWWEGLGPDERADEEAKAIEAGKEDEHLKESLCGGYGQSGAQKIAKGKWALEKLGLTKRWDEIEAAMKAIRSSDTSAQSEPGGTPAG